MFIRKNTQKNSYEREFDVRNLIFTSFKQQNNLSSDNTHYSKTLLPNFNRLSIEFQIVMFTKKSRFSFLQEKRL